jgi:hypothetical protein
MWVYPYYNVLLVQVWVDFRCKLQTVVRWRMEEKEKGGNTFEQVQLNALCMLCIALLSFFHIPWL